jgi:hypothetical protein
MHSFGGILSVETSSAQRNKDENKRGINKYCIAISL